MQLETVARWLIITGLALAALGALVFLASKIPGLDRLGRLPGDIRWESPGGQVTCIVPIVSMLLVSLILTVVLNVVIRLLNR